MATWVLILRRDQRRPLSVSNDEMHERFATWTRALASDGVLQGVLRHGPADSGCLLTAQSAEVQPIDDVGPGFVIGHYVITADDVAAARALAAGCPILSEGGSVEIRETSAFP